MIVPGKKSMLEAAWRRFPIIVDQKMRTSHVMQVDQKFVHASVASTRKYRINIQCREEKREIGKRGSTSQLKTFRRYVRIARHR